MQCISWENNIYAVHIIIIIIHSFGLNKMELDASVFLSEDSWTVLGPKWNIQRTQKHIQGV